MKKQTIAYWLVGIFAVVFIGGALVIPTPTLKTQVANIRHAITGSPKTTGATHAVAATDLGEKYQLSKQEIKTLQRLKVTGIGDSIMVRTTSDLKQVFGSFDAHAKVGRQVSAAPAIIRQLKANNAIQKNVLVNLGTNGPTDQATINGIIDQIGSQHEIYWVNTRVPGKKWQDANNQLIENAAKQYSNVHLIDWLYVSDGNDNWFDDDNLHPNTLGQREYTATVGQTMAKTATP
ncbi:esterase [Lactiplantibacillus modestisalitolerans]|uniref:Esterase n=1 Tax=Lactiplantibacillus modestisalitolerans TaxID=1457219 RepID=A0ABV5WSY6_9LACO|nr:esterase [Lactiplantibacillus modestisalitolerans]